MIDLKQFVDKLGDEGRDLRVDACRGIALWFIFLNHVPNNIGSWLTLSHYGFSDTTELFMFVSGLTCALAYGQVQHQDCWSAVVGHTLRRSWEIYVAFLILTQQPICDALSGSVRFIVPAGRRQSAQAEVEGIDDIANGFFFGRSDIDLLQIEEGVNALMHHKPFLFAPKNGRN